MDNKKWTIPMLLILVALSIGNIGLWRQNKNLEQEVRYLKNDYQNQLSMLRNDIHQIYSNVDQQLEAQASLITDLNYTLGAFNPKDHTVTLCLNITPKVLTEDMQVEISFQNQTVLCTRNGAVFQASLPVGLFVTYEDHPCLSIHSAGQTQTQQLTQVSLSYLFTSYLPNLSASTSGSITHSKDTLLYNQTLYIDFFSSTADKLAFAAGEPATPLDDTLIEKDDSDLSVTFEQFELFVLVNEEEVTRTDLTEAIKSSDTYKDCYYQTPFQGTYQACEGDTVKIYVEATDSLGYVHRILAGSWYQSDGATAEAMYEGELIYDSQGTLLFGKGIN